MLVIIITLHTFDFSRKYLNRSVDLYRHNLTNFFWINSTLNLRISLIFAKLQNN